jgi:hypothetical protein
MKRAKRRSLEQEYKRHVRRRQKEWERRWELPISSDEYLSSEQSLTAEDKYNCGDNTTILSSLATYLSLQLATRVRTHNAQMSGFGAKRPEHYRF